MPTIGGMSADLTFFSQDKDRNERGVLNSPTRRELIRAQGWRGLDFSEWSGMP